MRKIEQSIIRAIRAHKSISAGNSAVRSVTSDNGEKLSTVILHGSMVAVVGSNEVCVSLANWNTRTTRSRINAVLREFAPGWGVSVKNCFARLSGPDGKEVMMHNSDTYSIRLNDGTVAEV